MHVLNMHNLNFIPGLAPSTFDSEGLASFLLSVTGLLDCFISVYCDRCCFLFHLPLSLQIHSWQSK